MAMTVFLIMLLTIQELIALDLSAAGTRSRYQPNGPGGNGAMRLVHYGETASDLRAGVVQVWLNGYWGNICNNGGSFGSDEADVVCHQLGWSGASSYHNTYSSDHLDVNTPISLYYVTCASSHYRNILQCTYRTTSQTVCQYYNTVYVTCSGITTNPYDGQIRLQRGTYSNQGLVEVYCNGEWGTICGDSFGSAEATVICRQLGYNSAYSYNNLPIVSGNMSQSIWLHGIECPSSTYNCITSCASCPSTSAVYDGCYHSQDVTIECSVTSTTDSSSILTTVDSCVMDGPSSDGAIRLVRDGTTSPYYTSGIVQVWWNGQWGNICDDYSFGSDEADVICHQLGWSGASAFTSEYNGKDNKPASIRNLNCGSSQFLNIFQCSYSTTPSYDCTDFTDVSVSCYQTPIWDNPYDGQIRLQRGAYSNQGLVEVYCNGEWGTICNDGFGSTEARVVCHQLGYDSVYRYSYLPITGYLSKKIWLHAVQCSSPAYNCISSCASCPSAEYHNCYGNEMITVECNVSVSTTKAITDTDTCVGVNVGSSSHNNGAVIGGAVGGVLILIILIAVPVICVVVACVFVKPTSRSGPRYIHVGTQQQGSHDGATDSHQQQRLQDSSDC